MQVQKSKESLYLAGVLWNMANGYSREIMLKLAIMQDVIQVRIYDLEDEYDSFVRACYRVNDETSQPEFVRIKINSMKATNNTKIVVFIFKIDNPTYQVDKRRGILQCVEEREIKQQIRDEYSSKIEGYVLDNLIHISDNSQETSEILNILSRYERFLKEDYVRRGYHPIVKKNEVEVKKNYTELLKSLKEER